MLDGLINMEDTGTIGETPADSVVNPNQRDEIAKIPGPDDPLIFKIIPIPSNGKQMGYWRVLSHSHLVGDQDPSNRKNFRSHLCQKMLGHQECPECDKYWANYNRMKELEANNEKHSQEYGMLDRENKLLNQSVRGWALIATPGASRVRAIRFPKQALNTLWGKKATKYRPAVESLIQKMVEKGHNPYDVSSQTGWLKIYRTGEELSTQYHVEPATVTVTEKDEDGSDVEKIKAAKYSVHEDMLKLQKKDLLDPTAFEKNNTWSYEESQFFAENLQTPERVLNETNQDSSGGESGGEAQQETVGAAAASVSVPGGNGESDSTQGNAEEIDNFL